MKEKHSFCHRFVCFQMPEQIIKDLKHLNIWVRNYFFLKNSYFRRSRFSQCVILSAALHCLLLTTIWVITTSFQCCLTHTQKLTSSHQEWKHSCVLSMNKYETRKKVKSFLLTTFSVRLVTHVTAIVVKITDPWLWDTISSITLEESRRACSTCCA